MALAVTFGGVTVSAWQDGKVGYSRASKVTTLLSGNLFGSQSPKVTSFPRSFDCYTEDHTEIEALVGKMVGYHTLSINGTNYTNCEIVDISNEHEVTRDSGKWVYSIEFQQVDHHS
jgi:hypothetical protein